jgi:hypothetical protein
MDREAGGWLWLLIDVGLVGMFAVALLYGMLVWRKRRRGRLRLERDQATRDLYQRRDD